MIIVKIMDNELIDIIFRSILFATLFNVRVEKFTCIGHMCELTIK